MPFRGRPIWLEVFLAMLHTRGGLMAMYLLLYLAYTGLTKLTDSLGKAVVHVKGKVDKDDIPEILLEKEVTSEEWHVVTLGQKRHLLRHGEVSLCGIDLHGSYIAEDIDEGKKCRNCVRLGGLNN